MDIGEIKKAQASEDEPVELEIYDLAGELYTHGEKEEPCTISVLGSESKAYREVQDRHNKRVKKQVRAQRRRRVVSFELSDEEVEANALELIHTVVVAWKGWSNNGKALPLNAKNLNLLLEHPHIRAQIEEGIMRHAVFFKQASAS